VKTSLPTSILFCLLIGACRKNDGGGDIHTEGRFVRMVNHNGYPVNIFFDAPHTDTVDVIMTFHGTVLYDSLILTAAEMSVDMVKGFTDRTDILYAGVAYPEEGLLMGDNVAYAEAALLWMKEDAERELGKKIRKIFLVGHSQGGYVVTRLNTMHPTDGVVANGPGPLNLVLRCQLEESGQIASGETCSLLKETYGSVYDNPDAYKARSLLLFTDQYKGDILFVQGMQDSQIQMTSWPFFKQKLDTCSTCMDIQIQEEANYGHTALFDSPDAQTVYNIFINR
jgi:hypothetical protein